MYEVWEKGREKKTFIETAVFATVKKKVIVPDVSEIHCAE